jgi:exosortase
MVGPLVSAPAASASQTIRTPGWIAAAVGTLAAVLFVYARELRDCANIWATNPDYSFGFFVIPFAVYLAWSWRENAPATLKWPEPWGLACIVVGAVLFVIAGVTNWAQEWIKGLSLVVSLCGISLLLGGVKTLRWLWPSLAFLMFMFPLPHRVESWLGWQLQRFATIGSTFVLQTLGFPAYDERNLIHIHDTTLEVERACNGLSMMLMFACMSTAVAILVVRPWVDRLLILAAAIPIAVVCNVLRIVMTGIIFVVVGGDVVLCDFHLFGWHVTTTIKEFSHDFAGWLMMPVALAFLWVELKIIDWVLVADLARASREEVIKTNASNPSYLFMLNNPALGPVPGKKTESTTKKK